VKDNFSTQSHLYATYRPHYPSALFDYLISLVAQKKKAWDCGTGNGQVAYDLAKYFDDVYATDISPSQLENARQAPSIHYSLQPAEKTNFESSFFDLIVVAQAIHWFDFDAFYAEVRRTAKPQALLAVLGYARLEISRSIDQRILNFYEHIIGSYWDKERKYLDEKYATIPFPFEEIKGPRFEIVQDWTLKQVMGYLDTWSAVKHFIRQNGYSPLPDLQLELAPLWESEPSKKVRFPLLVRIGKLG
jgi:ubiquinone/menaquinone biosynthesis C-methylase UbiE